MGVGEEGSEEGRGVRRGGKERKGKEGKGSYEI